MTRSHADLTNQASAFVQEAQASLKEVDVALKGIQQKIDHVMAAIEQGVEPAECQRRIDKLKLEQQQWSQRKSELQDARAQEKHQKFEQQEILRYLTYFQEIMKTGSIP